MPSDPCNMPGCCTFQLLLLLLLLLLPGQSFESGSGGYGLQTAAAQDVDLQVNWSTFLGQHDLVWKFDTLVGAPTRWLEGAFVGDGLLGAGVRVVSERGGRLAIRVHVGRSDVWDRRTGNSKLSMGNNFQYDRPRLPIGWFDVQLKGRNLKGGRMRLSLFNGEVEGAVRTDLGEVEFHVYAHATDGVIVVAAQGSHGEVDPRWEFTPEKSAAPIWHVVGGNGYKLNPAPKKRLVASNTHISEQALLAGGSYSVVWKEEGGRLCLSISGVSRGRRGMVKAVEPVDRATRQRAEDLQGSHRSWWHAFWEERGAFITFPEIRGTRSGPAKSPSRAGQSQGQPNLPHVQANLNGPLQSTVAATWLEGFWYIQMYKLASATRADRFVIDNNGPWLFTPTTWADIHWDLNLQLSYLPMFTANRLDLSTSLVKYIQRPEVQKALAVCPE